ncbi:hypothetical protein EYC98_20080 [Halieaceae bacterium IMCC14734]|uniref:Uncharacterized protein n=1 Tax=Candidatus Litorirhabdus singularis TaxID=2518993 RepID=A0ABT3TLN2_9GAMM|nr:hypothetical protein [Candidatus Litorirhabdus singularis]MCX2983166.1 hypothetical protein [Candidatus Litorirhabdus singularis]
MSIMTGADVGADWVVAADVKVVTKDPENSDLYEWSLEYSEATGREADRVGRASTRQQETKQPR